MSKELSERKKKILHALVDVYISTGQPVSSADIQSKYMPEVSSATIRAELSALEALGYIDQPHTSAGRVPLKPAYQLYVGGIEEAGEKALTDAETAFIRSRFSEKLSEVHDISKRAAEIISDVTNYTSFVVSSRGGSVVIEEVKLVPLKRGRVLVLIVTDEGIISDKTLEVGEEIKHEYIDSATRMLNNVFAGKTVRELEEIDLDAELKEEMDGFRDLFDAVLAIIQTYMAEHADNVVVEGALKMLDYPEYNNVEDAKKFLAVISDRDSVGELLGGAEDSIEFSVRIGKEDSGVDKCAIITAAYKIGDEVVGRAGVIGPERMDYKKVIGVLEYMKKTMGTLLDDGDDKEKV